MSHPFSEKQFEFIANSTAKWNLAHGSMRSGKTDCTAWRFMEAVHQCPDSDIAMVGHTSTTIYHNVIRMILENPRFSVFQPFCTWFPSKHQLRYRNKIITAVGAKDERSAGLIQGRTLSLVYCDEMTLYPQSLIETINSRLSNDHSMGFASMNPTHPSHILKEWIDWAEEGDPKFYSLHFTLEDNPSLKKDYIEMLRKGSSGVFYKRNFLGMWCQAEGAIFESFDRDHRVVKRNPPNEYWIASIDCGQVNPFACLLIGISSGKYTQEPPHWCVQKEFYWDPKKKGRQKTNYEFADDVRDFLEPYGVKKIYVDPSAEDFQIELRRRGFHPIHANNDVENGISKMVSAVDNGAVSINESCVNLIREIEGYVWDPKAAKDGYDEPLKMNDHAVDALRYAIASHKVDSFDEQAYYRKQEEFMRQKYHPGGYGFKGF